MLPTYGETQRVSARHKSGGGAPESKMMAKGTSEKDVRPQLRFPVQARPWKCHCDQSFSSVINKRMVFLIVWTQFSKLPGWFLMKISRAHTHTLLHTCAVQYTPTPPGLSNTCCDTTPVSYIPMYGSSRHSVGTGERCGQDAVRSPGQTFSMHHDRDGMTAINPTVALHTVGAISPRTQRHKCTFR